MSLDALRAAYADLQQGRFQAAYREAEPHRGQLSGALIFALADAALHGPDPAAVSLARIAATHPGTAHPVHDLVDLLHRHGRGAEVIGHLEAARRHRPSDHSLTVALSIAHTEHGSPEVAIELFRAEAQRNPGHAAHWSNLGKVLAAAGRDAEAEEAFERVRRMEPDNPYFALNAGVARLRTGDLVGGAAGFRARHTLPGRDPGRPGPELRRLDEAPGRTVALLHDEGYGDTLQFIRYVPLLQAAGATVQVEVPPALTRLLRDSGIPAAGIGVYDTWCRIPDLPAVFGTAIATIPAAIPYLRADPERAAAWAAIWAARLPPGRRVGLVWAGAPRPHDPGAAMTDRQRSVPPQALGPLLAVPGITWISLQLGAAPPAGVHDPMPEVQDFADTAAIVANLDTVVSVDTAVAHLAAAMGKPTLLLDRYDNCWRWFRGRDDSPWYPGVLRIIRQERPGNWPGVLRRAAAALGG